MDAEPPRRNDDSLRLRGFALKFLKHLAGYKLFSEEAEAIEAD